MKSKSIIIGALVSLGLVFWATRSCSEESSEPEYPESPKDGQVYTRNGTSSVWNAALGYWAISSMMNGRSQQHRYYPNTQSYTNSAGAKVATPAFVTNSKGKSVSKRGFGSSSRGRSGS